MNTFHFFLPFVKQFVACRSSFKPKGPGSAAEQLRWPASPLAFIATASPARPIHTGHARVATEHVRHIHVACTLTCSKEADVAGRAGPMRAVAFLAPSRVDFVEVPIPAVTPGRVLLRTLAAGVCQTDLHIRRGTDARIAAGRIPRARNSRRDRRARRRCLRLAGRSAGRRVPGVVVRNLPGLPGRQAQCLPWRDGRHGIPPTPGITADGGMAEYISVPASALSTSARLIRPWRRP